MPNLFSEAKISTGRSAMAKRKVGKGKPRKRNRATGSSTTDKGKLIECRCHKQFLADVDKWREPSGMSRAAAIVQLAAERLAQVEPAESALIPSSAKANP
jgi:hypothetical protein